jgi:hypothetical protein
VPPAVALSKVSEGSIQEDKETSGSGAGRGLNQTATSGLLDISLLAELKPETLNKINRRLMVSMRSKDNGPSGAVPVVEGGSGAGSQLASDRSSSSSDIAMPSKINVASQQQAVAEGATDRSGCGISDCMHLSHDPFS